MGTKSRDSEHFFFPTKNHTIADSNKTLSDLDPTQVLHLWSHLWKRHLPKEKDTPPFHGHARVEEEEEEGKEEDERGG